mgnify:CR=1 FL=1
MKRQIVNYRSVNQKRAIVEYMNGEKTLFDTSTNKDISHPYDEISDFKYNEDLNTEVSLVKLNIGKNLRRKDTLIGYINIEGKLVSNIYSIYFDKLYNVTDEKLDDLTKVIYDKLFCDSKVEEQKEKEATLKMSLLFKINKQ